MVKVKSRRQHILLPEIRRWLLRPAFLAAVILSGAFIVMDELASMPNGVLLREREVNSVFYHITSSSGFLKYTGLCMCTFLAAGLFAEDYEENAVYMRIQRLGKVHYAFGRIVHTVVSAWVCAFLAEFVSMAILVAGFGQVLFEPDVSRLGGWLADSVLLKEGKNISYCLIVTGICGFRAAFYALMALAFSVIVPSRKALVSVPLLLWYFNQYMLTRIEWLPAWMYPSRLYTEGNFMAISLGVSEWTGFLVVVIYTFAVACLVFLLLWFSLRRNRIFGGRMG